MKCRKTTLERVIREKFCDVGRYRYHMFDGSIKRKPISELNILPRYGDGWETIARYNYQTDKWELSD